MLSGEQAIGVFGLAARLITERTWTQHDRDGTGGLTVDVALCKAAGCWPDRRSRGWEHTPECDEAVERFCGALLVCGLVPFSSPWQQNAAALVTPVERRQKAQRDRGAGDAELGPGVRVLLQRSRGNGARYDQKGGLMSGKALAQLLVILIALAMAAEAVAQVVHFTEKNWPLIAFCGVLASGGILALCLLARKASAGAVLQWPREGRHHKLPQVRAGYRAETAGPGVFGARPAAELPAADTAPLEPGPVEIP